MAPPHLFFVRYEAGAALTACVGLSPAAELAHRRLLDITWANGQPPLAHAHELAGIARCTLPQWLKIRPRLLAAGWHVHHGRFCHPTGQRVLADALAFLRSARTWGKAGARKRWGHSNPIGTPCQPYSDPNGVPIAKSSNSSSTTNNTFNDERSTRSPSALKKGVGPESQTGPAGQPRKGEREFLQEVRDTCDIGRPGRGSKELRDWGGWWRNRFRENPDKARRILAEVRSMDKEQRLAVGPGPAAYDLWSRLP
jgi:hypothetical protein